jgi:hypothetical protein
MQYVMTPNRCNYVAFIRVEIIPGFALDTDIVYSYNLGTFHFIFKGSQRAEPSANRSPVFFEYEWVSQGSTQMNQNKKRLIFSLQRQRPKTLRHGGQTSPTPGMSPFDR